MSRLFIFEFTLPCSKLAVSLPNENATCEADREQMLLDLKFASASEAMFRNDQSIVLCSLCYTTCHLPGITLNPGKSA